jgi:hypothetical protein
MPDYVSYVTYVVPLSCGGVSPAHDDYVVNLFLRGESLNGQQ